MKKDTDMKRPGLTDEQLAHYREEGFVVVPCLFDGEDLRAAEEAIEELTERAVNDPANHAEVLELEPEPVDGKRVPRRIYNPFLTHEGFRAIATHEKMLGCIEDLVGPNIDIQHSKLNMKPAHVGSVVEWHQDLPFFPHTNDDLVSTLVYLDEATKENGCLEVVPRMHGSYLEHVDEDGYFTGIISQELDAERIPLEGRAGSVIFMHPLTPHGSLANTSPKGRRTLIFEYRASDAFPIYFGELTHRNEQTAVHVQGEQPRIARVGGPAPVLPLLRDSIASIYDLQERSKANGVKQPKFAT
ncbi:MAG: ectoine hydroxylase-related dioxygenase (phytanoyl-CoA dioxygenase family) [Akkermansiaceae bacterium]|jgi:ectoine hydroxylase-related dioxygenase (phytanoyl-CoA dioxygenase family)